MILKRRLNQASVSKQVKNKYGHGTNLLQLILAVSMRRNYLIHVSHYIISTLGTSTLLSALVNENVIIFSELIIRYV